MTSKDKIQHLLITHLLKEGFINLNLPDNMNLEISITHEGKSGYMEKKDNYCLANLRRGNKEISLDSYNAALRLTGNNDNIIFDDSFMENLEPVRILNVI